MADASEQSLGWIGGLNSFLHEAYIGVDELSDMDNVIGEDGTLRLDRRYIKYLERQAADDTPRGSGWGKYSTGSQSEQYLVVLNTTMYQVDLTAAVSVAAVGGATSLAASDWWFQQFQDYMYAGNVTDGLGRKKLFAGSNGTGDWTLIQLPTAPAAAPGAVPGAYQSQTSFLGSADTHSPALGAGESSTYESAGDLYRIVYATTGAGAGTREVIITYDTSPDTRPNLQYNDVIAIASISGSTGGTPEVYITSAAGTTKAIYWRRDPITRDNDTRYLYYRLQNISRSSRTTVTAIKVVYVISLPAGSLTIRLPSPRIIGGVWLSLDSSTNPGESFPTLKELSYESTYYNSTTGLESAPSPAKIVGAAEQDPYGEWRTLTAATSAQSGVDFVRFYRVVTEGGIKTRYRIASVANSGSPSTTDKYPLEEVKAFTVFLPSVLPNSGITNLTAWQNRLVLAVGTLVYISRDGQPLVFEQQSGAFDLRNSARGLTFYPDDKRGEDIISVIGQDDLYMISKYSVRCLVGNSPDNWRLLKLPDSEGAVGPRAVAPYKKGILVFTPSGRLLYHHSSLLEPQIVSSKVDARIGNSGISALATSAAVVTVWPDGEIEVANGTAYYKRSVEGKWRKGTRTHGVHSTLPVPGIAPRWIGTNGKFYEGGSDSYVSDGGTTGTNGTAVTWYAVTRKDLMQRSAITNVFWGDSTESPTSGTPTLPKIDLITDRGTVTYTKRDAKYNVNAKITNNGYGFKYKIYGNKDAAVETCRIEFRPMPQARHK